MNTYYCINTARNAQVAVSLDAGLDDNKSAASCFNKSANQVATSLIFADLLQLNDYLQQAGKTHNLSHVCGISGCVCYMQTLFGKSVNNNHYCYKQVSKNISHDCEKIRRI